MCQQAAYSSPSYPLVPHTHSSMLCKAQWVCADQRIVLYKSYLLSFTQSGWYRPGIRTDLKEKLSNLAPHACWHFLFSPRSLIHCRRNLRFRGQFPCLLTQVNYCCGQLKTKWPWLATTKGSAAYPRCPPHRVSWPRWTPVHTQVQQVWGVWSADWWWSSNCPRPSGASGLHLLSALCSPDAKRHEWTGHEEVSVYTALCSPDAKRHEWIGHEEVGVYTALSTLCSTDTERRHEWIGHEEVGVYTALSAVSNSHRLKSSSRL